MKVVNISKNVIIGRRFNNFDATSRFAQKGCDHEFIAWNDEGNLNVQVAGNKRRNMSNRIKKALGNQTGNLNAYYSNAKHIKSLPNFMSADILHMHIMHEYYLSINDWKILCENKPVVWTWHDPYMMSGHCIYNKGCEGFVTGCEKCPHLDYHFPIKKDRAALNLSEKISFFSEADVRIIVASKFMEDLLNKSLYKNQLRYDVVPFGIDKPKNVIPNEKARTALGIKPWRIVLGLRAVYSDYKGCDLVLHALQRFCQEHPNFPITLITFQEREMFNHLLGDIDVINVGWISDDKIFNYFSAMDIFLMPSRQEAFGIMALEAMSCGANVMALNGTSLPEIINSPSIGQTSGDNPEEFYESLSEMIFKTAAYGQSRDTISKYALQHYNINQYVERLVGIYNDEIEYFNNK